MCGIAGLMHYDGRSAEVPRLRRMADAIRHRGPDGEGFFTDGPLGFAHRRLAIIDLSPAAHQPMATPDGRFVLTYNGECYNFHELRIELEALGHQFRSRTDSEVVLHALAEWGTRAILRFNGMFAFALWDRRERTLLLARDRCGIKPLYYAVAKNTFVFASEIKAILAQGSLRAEMDLEGLLEYMTFQNFFTDRTLFRAVRTLPAGSYMTVTQRGKTEITRYWDFAFQEPTTAISEDDYAEELHRLFHQAVSRQLVADVDIGSYLSGGIDSGAITAVASPQLPNLTTFTVGFDMRSAAGLELSFDERPKAEHMSYQFRTEHYEMVLKSGDMERAMGALVRALEEPRVGQSYPNYYAAKLSSRFVKVMLSGTGGDELFGGYPWRYYRAAVNNDFEHYVDKYYAFWQRLIPGETLSQIFAPVWNTVKHVSPRDIFRDVYATHESSLSRPEDYVNHSFYFEAKTFLHGLLIVEDKLAMANGLETRVPFLDNDLIDFAMRLPVRLKLRSLGEVARLNENEPGAKAQQYFERTRDGKVLLRKVLSQFVPETIASGHKQGFSAPDASWFRGESIDYVRRTLMTPSARIYDVLDRKAVQSLINEHLEGRENRRLLIWALLFLEVWIAEFIDGAKSIRLADDVSRPLAAGQGH